MKRAYKYRLNPTPEQIVFFNKSFGCCRFVYNYMLGKRIEAYQRDKTKIGWVELAKMLTELKKERWEGMAFGSIKRVPATIHKKYGQRVREVLP